ncbi:hypothetical protein EDC04DRAFT_2223073 [Pisolithus marmoratus]|nr:hypothetical protein EDC04DRAFT_2223073 [Pisolithus marmoratus]
MGVRAGIVVCITSFLLGEASSLPRDSATDHRHDPYVHCRVVVYTLDCRLTHTLEVTRHGRASLDRCLVLLCARKGTYIVIIHSPRHRRIGRRHYLLELPRWGSRQSHV